MNEREGRNFIVNNLKGWKTFNSTELALVNNEDRLVRILGDIRENEFWAIASYLKDYADPKNADKSGTVTDPEVDHQTATGTWRHLSCYMVRTNERGEQAQDGKNFNLVQELRRGFLTTLAEDEARLIQGEMSPGSGASPNANKEKTITLQWKAVDPDLIDSLATGEVKIDTVSQPKHRRSIVKAGDASTVNIDVTGLDVRLHTATVSLDEDGTGTVTVTMGDSQFELTGFANWLGSRQAGIRFIYNVPEQLAQGVIEALKSKGVDVSVSSYRDGKVDLRVTTIDLTGITLSEVKVGENCDFTEYASFYWNGQDETSLPIPGTIPAGTSYTGRNVSENGDGTYTITLQWRVRKYRNLTEFDSEHRSDQDETTKEWKGVTNQDLGTALNEQSGKVVRVNKQFNDDCSENITRRVVTPSDQTTTSGEDRADQSSTVTDHTQAEAAVTAPPTATAGTVARVRNRETEFGKFATTEETITAKAQTTTHDSESRADRSASTVVEKNAIAKADATPVTGKVVRASSRENQFGRFDNTKETITPISQTTTHDSEDSAARSASRTVATNAEAKQDATAAAAGTVTRAQSRENEFGRFDNTLETITGKAQTTSYTSESRADQSAARVVARNAEAKQDATADPGKVVRATSQENEFGRFDNTLETVTPVAQTGSWTFDRGYRDPDGTVYWGRNVTEAGFATWLAALTGRVSPSVRINEFGLLDYTVSVMPEPSSFSSTRPPFTNYSAQGDIPDIVQRQIIGGKPYKRSFANCKMRVVGNHNESSVLTYLEPCNYKITVNPQASGQFFHGKGIIAGAIVDPGWVADGELPA